MFMPRRFWISGTVLLGLASILLIFSADVRAGDKVQPEFQKPEFKLIELAMFFSRRREPVHGGLASSSMTQTLLKNKCQSKYSE